MQVESSRAPDPWPKELGGRGALNYVAGLTKLYGKKRQIIQYSAAQFLILLLHFLKYLYMVILAEQRFQLIRSMFKNLNTDKIN